MRRSKAITIVGASYNALVCASYVAKAGTKSRLTSGVRAWAEQGVDTEAMWWEPCEAHKGADGSSKPGSDCEKCLVNKCLVDTSWANYHVLYPIRLRIVSKTVEPVEKLCVGSAEAKIEHSPTLEHAVWTLETDLIEGAKFTNR